jgi:hypothetical protein
VTAAAVRRLISNLVAAVRAFDAREAGDQPDILDG